MNKGIKLFRTKGIIQQTYLTVTLLTLIPMLLFTLVTYELTLNDQEHSLQVKLFAIAGEISSKMQDFRPELRKVAEQELSHDVKVLRLNRVIQPLIDEVSQEHHEFGLGFYDIRLDSIIAIAPNFEAGLLKQIPRTYPYFKSYQTGKPELTSSSTSVGWKGKGIVAVTIPVYIDNQIIGHIWVNMTTERLVLAAIKESIKLFFIGLFIWLTIIFLIRRLIKQISLELDVFTKATLQGEFERQHVTIPELVPLAHMLTEYAQDLETDNSIVLYSNDAIIGYDLQGKILNWNAAAERIFGYSAQEVIGHNVSVVFFPDKADDIEMLLAKLARGEDIKPYEGIIRRKDGEGVEVLATLSPVRDVKRKITGVAGIVKDIGEHKKVEREMARLSNLNVIAEMAAGISHEIRNPMTTVRGFLQMIGSKQDTQNYKDYFELMIEELDRANDIISEFLSLSRNKPVQMEPTNLNEVILRILPMIQADAVGQDKYIEADLEDIPQLLLNEKEMRQLILNVSRNGIEAMQEGGLLQIRTRVEQDRVVLIIKDQGPGIPAFVLENLGKPFLTSKDNGTGLGLAVCYGIVNRHRGKIEVETGNAGTSFMIYFPFIL